MGAGGIGPTRARSDWQRARAPAWVRWSGALCAGLLLALTSPALGQTDAQVKRAQKLFRQGQVAYDEGNFEEAAEKMEHAFQITRSPELAFNAGRVYERMSAYDQAIHYFRIYLKRGKADEKEKKDIRERIADLEAAKKRQREQVFTAPPSKDELTAEAHTFFKRGVAMFKRKHYQAAMQAFTQAYRFAELPEVIYNLAVASERVGRSQDAIDYYREYLRRRDNPPDRHLIEQRIDKLRREGR